jgi:hypothetical protein
MNKRQRKWFLRFHNHEAFCLSFLPFLQSQDLLHHNMACSVLVSLNRNTEMDSSTWSRYLGSDPGID